MPMNMLCESVRKAVYVPSTKSCESVYECYVVGWACSGNGTECCCYMTGISAKYKCVRNWSESS